MKDRVEQVSAWVYGGIWGVLTRWFRVPDRPPNLPTHPGEQVDSFRPAPGFLRLLKLQFWIVFCVIDALIFIAWLAITIASPIVGLILVPLALALAIVPDVIAYLAIHLRYDTTWYVMSERSLRIRRGIWVIHETTITFENVQNVNVKQGPLQRLFGIANVTVETAGGGGTAGQQAHGAQSTATHHGLIEGVADAQRIRNLVLSRLRRSRSAGLGDDVNSTDDSRPSWQPQHLAVLRDIRNAVQALVKQTD